MLVSPRMKVATDLEKLTINPKYREVVGSIMYLAVATRPEIAHIVIEKNWGVGKRVLRQLIGTARQG